MKFKLSLLFLFGLIALTVAVPLESTEDVADDTPLEDSKEQAAMAALGIKLNFSVCSISTVFKTS